MSRSEDAWNGIVADVLPCLWGWPGAAQVYPAIHKHQPGFTSREKKTYPASYAVHSAYRGHWHAEFLPIVGKSKYSRKSDRWHTFSITRSISHAPQKHSYDQNGDNNEENEHGGWRGMSRTDKKKSQLSRYVDLGVRNTNHVTWRSVLSHPSTPYWLRHIEPSGNSAWALKCEVQMLVSFSLIFATMSAHQLTRPFRYNVVLLASTVVSIYYDTLAASATT